MKRFLRRVFILMLMTMVLMASAAVSDTVVSIWPRDIITLGQYPQTARGNDKTPIEWVVLEIQDGKALLISKYGLDCQPYHSSKKSITWEKCSLRAWLNKDFLKKAFTKEEQEAILTTEIDNGKDQVITKDKVFLLSSGEANTYFHATSGGYNNGASRVTPTAYALAKRKAYTDDWYRTSDDEPAGWWWLRSKGAAQDYTYTIRANGGLGTDKVNLKTLVVRPALWVDLHHEVFKDYQYDSEAAPPQESLSGERFQSWFDEGAGRLLPKLELQSGEELQTELYVNDEQQCDVRVYNALAEDYRAYVFLLLSYSFKIVDKGDHGIRAISPQGYEVYVSFSGDMEVFIYAPTVI